MMDLTERRQHEAAGRIPYGAHEVAPSREGVRVTIAIGQVVFMHPHPSGVPGLPPLVLHGGETLFLPEEQAERLYNRRVVLHPVTGKEKPQDPPPRAQAPGITYGNGAHLGSREYRELEREAVEKHEREMAAEKEGRSKPRAHGDREGQASVRTSWLTPPDVGW